MSQYRCNYFLSLKLDKQMSNKNNVEKEYILVKNDRVSCDGGELGHPKVYLIVNPDQEVLCPYCSKKFKNNKSN